MLFFYVYFVEVYVSDVLKEVYLWVYAFFNQMWYFDYLYSKVFVELYICFSYSVSYLFIDRGYFEILGPYGIAWFFDVCSSKSVRMEVGYIGQYIFVMLCGVVLMCGWFCFRFFLLPFLVWFSALEWHLEVSDIEVNVWSVAVNLKGVPFMHMEFWWPQIGCYVLLVKSVWSTMEGLICEGLDFFLSVPHLYEIVEGVFRFVLWLCLLIYSSFSCILSCWAFLFSLFSTLTFCDYFYFFELFYVLALSVVVFILWGIIFFAYGEEVELSSS